MIFTMIIVSLMCCQLGAIGENSVETQLPPKMIRIRFKKCDHQKSSILISPVYKPPRYSSHQFHDPDVEEAFIMQRFFHGSVGFVRKCIHFCGYTAPLIGDTFGLINSWPAKIIGKYMKSIATLFNQLAFSIRGRSIMKSSTIMPSTSIICERIWNSVAICFIVVARVLNGLSRVFTVAGETVQAMASSLGQSLSDSFFSLDGIPSTMQKGAKFWLQYRKKYTLSLPASDELPISPNSSSEQNESMGIQHSTCSLTPQGISKCNSFNNNSFRSSSARRWIDGQPPSSSTDTYMIAADGIYMPSAGIKPLIETFPAPGGGLHLTADVPGVKESDLITCSIVTRGDDNYDCKETLMSGVMWPQSMCLFNADSPILSTVVNSTSAPAGSAVAGIDDNSCTVKDTTTKAPHEAFLSGEISATADDYLSSLFNTVKSAIRGTCQMVSTWATQSTCYISEVPFFGLFRYCETAAESPPEVASTSPLQPHLVKPSASLHFIQSLVAISVAFVISFVSAWLFNSWIMKTGVMICAVFGSAWCISHAHSNYLTRAVLIAEITAVDMYLQSLRTQSLHLPYSKVSIYENTSSDPVKTGRPFLGSQEGPMLETSLWVNGLLSSLWDKDRAKGGGMGEYLSKLAMDMINEQLRDLPPGIGNLHVTRLSFGAHAPLVRGVRSIGRYPSMCARYFTPTSSSHLQAESVFATSVGNRYTQTRDATFNLTNETRSEWEDKDVNNATSRLDEILTQLRSISTHSWGAFKTILNGKLRWPASSMPTESAIKMVPCERVIVDLDLSYLSSDLDVVISLRKGSALSSSHTSSRYTTSTPASSSLSDVSITLHEDEEERKTSERSTTQSYGGRSFSASSSAAVSEVAISGVVRVDAEVIEHYPFLGNATLSFLEVPSFHVTLSALGGIRSKHLSSLPVIQRVLDATVLWYIQQYTYPNSCEVDLYAFFCPECLVHVPPPPTVLELMIRAGRFTEQGLKRFGRAMKHWVTKTKDKVYGTSSRTNSPV